MKSTKLTDESAIAAKKHNREDNMNRTDIIREIAAQVRCNQTVAEMALDAALRTIVETVNTGGKVRLRGFGSFKLKRRAPRVGRNPKTGAVVSIPPSSCLHFVPAQALRHIHGK